MINIKTVDSPLFVNTSLEVYLIPLKVGIRDFPRSLLSVSITYLFKSIY